LGLDTTGAVKVKKMKESLPETILTVSVWIAGPEGLSEAGQVYWWLNLYDDGAPYGISLVGLNALMDSVALSGQA
jgi:hypothetical protein